MRYINIVACPYLLLNRWIVCVIFVLYMQGPYEIISMSGSFLNTESNGTVTKTGSLSVSLARPDGQVVGGCVAGMLVAGSQVQVSLYTRVNSQNLQDAD